MKAGTALLAATLLAATLSGCGGPADTPAAPVGEEQALQRAEAMLEERAPDTAATPTAPAP